MNSPWSSLRRTPGLVFVERQAVDQDEREILENQFIFWKLQTLVLYE